MSIEDTMKIVELEEKLKIVTVKYCQAINLIEATIVTMEDGDFDEALQMLKESS